MITGMRTTVTLDDDVAAALERLRRERSIGLSEAINELIRAGLTVRRPRRPFRQPSERIGLRIDVTNVAEALELLEGPAAR
jgi:metal-responsive CopG/Arc/MetJ family transcriptional regulator